VYARVAWWTPVPPEQFTATGRVTYVSGSDSGVEIGVSTEGRLRDRILARASTVFRTAGQAASWGERGLSLAPAATSLRRRRTLVIDEAGIRQFTELSGTSGYPLHEDLGYAWAHGFPNVLVQGVILVLLQVHIAGLGERGELEMWFRRPVPAGSLLETCQSQHDAEVWAWRLVATRETVAVARVRDDPAG
jgi:hypothetical protein